MTDTSERPPSFLGVNTWHSVFERLGQSARPVHLVSSKHSLNTSRWIKDTGYDPFLFLVNPAGTGAFGSEGRGHPGSRELPSSLNHSQSPRCLHTDRCAAMNLPTSVHFLLISLSSLSLTRGPISISISVDPPRLGHHPRPR